MPSNQVRTNKPAPWKGKGTSAAARIDFIRKYCRVPRGVGAGQLAVLLPFQTEFIEELYAEGVKTAGLSLPRGNGKSQLAAWIALSELYLEEYDPDIGIAATKLQQAARNSGVFGLAKRCVELEPEMRDRTKFFASSMNISMTVPYNNGVCAVFTAGDPDSALGLSSSLLIADEFGSDFWTPERWGALVQAGGKRGGDSRVLGVSTPNSKHSAMYSLRSAIVQGRKMPGTYWCEYAADPTTPTDDRDSWYKANPALGHYLSIDQLESEIHSQPGWLFDQMRRGLWVDAGSSGWLGVTGPDNFDAGQTTDTIDRDEPCYIGVDKSKKGDCSAVVLIQRKDAGWLVLPRIFKPDPLIDHAEVRDYIRELCSTYRVAAVGYDDRYFVEGAQELAEERLPMIDVPQTMERLGPRYVELFQLVQTRNLFHNGDSEYRSHVLSPEFKSQTGSTFMLEKNRTTKRNIDGAVATAIALSVSDQPLRNPNAKFIIAVPSQKRVA